jgi:hypothetical protein
MEMPPARMTELGEAAVAPSVQTIRERVKGIVLRGAT